MIFTFYFRRKHISLIEKEFFQMISYNHELWKYIHVWDESHYCYHKWQVLRKFLPTSKLPVYLRISCFSVKFIPYFSIFFRTGITLHRFHPVSFAPSSLIWASLLVRSPFRNNRFTHIHWSLLFGASPFLIFFPYN